MGQRSLAACARAQLFKSADGSLRAQEHVCLFTRMCASANITIVLTRSLVHVHVHASVKEPRTLGNLAIVRCLSPEGSPLGSVAPLEASSVCFRSLRCFATSACGEHGVG